MLIDTREYAAGGDRFDPDAFSGALGGTATLTVRGQRIGTATLVGAEVAADGRSVRLTLDVPSGECPPGCSGDDVAGLVVQAPPCSAPPFGSPDRSSHPS